MIGKVLGTRYEILEKIGTGGMGDVYKAHDRRLDRIVAIKILKAQYNDETGFIKKFKRESLVAVTVVLSAILAIPKSVTFTLSSWVIMIFGLLISLWTIPFAWATLSASKI